MSVGYAQPKTGWEKEGLKGKVKSVTQLKYKAKIKAGKIVKGDIDCKYLCYKSEFDSKGKLTSNTDYTPDGKPNNKIIIKTNITLEELDKIDKELQEISKELKNDLRESYKYNSQNDIIQETIYAGLHTLLTLKYMYEYDDKNNWTQQTEYYLIKDVATPTQITERQIEYFNE